MSTQPSRPSCQALGRADRLALSLIRRRAAGQGVVPLLTAVAVAASPGQERGMVESLVIFMDVLGEKRGPSTALHPVPCRHVGPDEWVLLRLLSALQGGDEAAARAFAFPLARTATLDRLLMAAKGFALQMLRAGQHLSPTEPPPDLGLFSQGPFFRAN